MKRILTLLLISTVIFSCKKDWRNPTAQTVNKKIVTGPGPEDIILDESVSPARILVSCNARREGEPYLGEIYQINPTNDEATVLPRTGEPAGFTFNPHGIDILKESGNSYLYVVSHRSFNDSLDVIARYKILPGSLEFEAFFTDPVMVSPNSLTVLPNGSFYVTNADGGGDVIYEQLFNPMGGSVIFCDGIDHWKKVADKLMYPNGLANRDNKLYLATSRNKALFTFDISGNGDLSNKYALNHIDGGDNLRWDGDDLILAVHPDQLKFVAYSVDADAVSPSETYRINTTTGDKTLLFKDDGNQISASATGLIYQDNLYLSQIFDAFVLKVPLKK